MIIISEDQLLGALAKWAIRQSPYLLPDNLEGALRNFNIEFNKNNKFQEEFPRWYAAFQNKAELYEAIKEAIFNTPEIVLWNDRKNGNKSPLGFISRYDEPDPDNDFIDIDALIGNITRDITAEE